MENPVEHHYRLSDRATAGRLNHSLTYPPATPGPTPGTRNKEKLVQASGLRTRQARPRPATPHQPANDPLEISHPRNQA